MDQAYLRNIFAVFRVMTKIRKLNRQPWIRQVGPETPFFHQKQITRLADVARINQLIHHCET